MSSLGRYIFTIIIAAILTGVLQTILPGKSLSSTMVKLTTGIFMVLVALSPLVKVRLDNTLDYISNVEIDASAIISEAEMNSKKETEKIIAQNTEAYILDRASELGADIEAKIEFQEDVLFVPLRVKITGYVSPITKRRLVSIIENDLGISEDLQIWEQM